MTSSFTDEQIQSFKAFRRHDFEADDEYKASFAHLESQGIAPVDPLKAQINYFSRKHASTPITLTMYKRYLNPPLPDLDPDASTLPPPTTDRTVLPAGQPPVPLPFQELAALIAQGRAGEIPVMEVKDGEVQAEPAGGEAQAGEPRKKPWETSAAGGA